MSKGSSSNIESATAMYEAEDAFAEEVSEEIAHALGLEKFAGQGNGASMAFNQEDHEGLTAHVSINVTTDGEKPNVLDVRNAISDAVTQLTGAQILDAHTMIGMSYGAALLRLPNGEFVILKAYIGVAEEEDVACALHDSDQVAEWAKYRKMKAEHEGREINPAVASLAASEDRKILERAQAINEAAQEASGGLRKEPKR